jgi:hypothetical protein
MAIDDEDTFIHKLTGLKLDDLAELTLIQEWDALHGDAHAADVKVEDAASDDASDQKANHAKYMRYWRGCHNVKTCGSDIFNHVRGGKGHLYDLWTEAKESWASVKVMFEKWCIEKTTSFSMDQYRTKKQLVKFYAGDEKLVAAIVKEKESRGHPWVIPHPEAPDNEEARLYLAWSASGSKKEEEHGQKTQVRGEAQVDITTEKARDSVAEFCNAGLTSPPLVHTSGSPTSKALPATLPEDTRTHISIACRACARECAHFQ